MREQKIVGEPLRLLAEDEIVALAKARLGIDAGRFGREKVQFFFGHAEERFFHTFVHFNLDEVPIVEPRAL